MNVLSLFDGMSCGQIAFKQLGINIDNYYAYEIDKFAVENTLYNFPNTKQLGDVFNADFTQYKDIDFVVGGSPCVPAESKIKTDTGYRNIEDVVIGDMVLTHKNRYRPVIRLYQRQSDHLYHIRYDGDKNLDITGNHPVYVYRSGSYDFIRVDELTTDDYITFNSSDMTVTDDKILFKIESIAKEDIDILVYNIEVEDDNSYTVNNCIVHNCTYWSIAQSADKREVTASGIGWELFSQYVRALKESKPKYFIYENNKSMSDDIRKSITDTFGFEPILINSALVSAQNRERLYWVGELNADGTYNRVNVCQPEDMNITVSDILDTVGVVLKYERSEQGKQLRKDYESGKIHHGFNEYRNLVPRTDGKSNTISTVSKDNQIIEPICVALRGRYADTGNRYKKGNEKVTQYVEARGNKSNTLTTVSKDNMIAEPIYSVPINTNDYNKSMCMCAGYYKSGMFDIIANITQKRTGVAEIVDFDVNSNTVIKLDDKEYKVYEVRNGNITYNNKTYPIKLADGNYIIRRLSVSECMKLQTVPDWYKWSVSNSQALKMLGNGWTVNVICHLINSCLDTSIREKVIKKHKLF